MALIHLYSLATPNGQKASIALEEMNLSYEAHRVDILKGEQFHSDFIKINPNSKIPAIVDLNGPGGKPINIMESGAILMYLAQKSGKFLAKDERLKFETLQWLFFQVGGVGPMFGQLGHFYKYAKEKVPYGIERYKAETKRLLQVLETRLEGRKYLVGEEYSIADMATVPWVVCLDEHYHLEEVLELKSYKNVMSWVERVTSRPLTAKGMKVCS